MDFLLCCDGCGDVVNEEKGKGDSTGLLFSRRGVVLGGVAVILLMCSAALHHIVGKAYHSYVLLFVPVLCLLPYAFVLHRSKYLA